jgi:hypothetical protein
MTDDERRVSVVANAIGFEMLRHDGRPMTQIDGVDAITVSEEESQRCLAAAKRTLEHLTAFDSGGDR